jgi:hypothetical protein
MCEEHGVSCIGSAFIVHNLCRQQGGSPPTSSAQVKSFKDRLAFKDHDFRDMAWHVLPLYLLLTRCAEDVAVVPRPIQHDHSCDAGDQLYLD